MMQGISTSRATSRSAANRAVLSIYKTPRARVVRVVRGREVAPTPVVRDDTHRLQAFIFSHGTTAPTAEVTCPVAFQYSRRHQMRDAPLPMSPLPPTQDQK